VGPGRWPARRRGRGRARTTPATGRSAARCASPRGRSGGSRRTRGASPSNRLPTPSRATRSNGAMSARPSTTRRPRSSARRLRASRALAHGASSLGGERCRATRGSGGRRRAWSRRPRCRGRRRSRRGRSPRQGRPGPARRGPTRCPRRGPTGPRRRARARPRGSGRGRGRTRRRPRRGWRASGARPRRRRRSTTWPLASARASRKSQSVALYWTRAGCRTAVASKVPAVRPAASTIVRAISSSCWSRWTTLRRRRVSLNAASRRSMRSSVPSPDDEAVWRVTRPKNSGWLAVLSPSSRISIRTSAPGPNVGSSLSANFRAATLPSSTVRRASGTRSSSLRTSSEKTSSSGPRVTPSAVIVRTGTLMSAALPIEGREDQLLAGVRLRGSSRSLTRATRRWWLCGAVDLAAQRRQGVAGADDAAVGQVGRGLGRELVHGLAGDRLDELGGPARPAAARRRGRTACTGCRTALQAALVEADGAETSVSLPQVRVQERSARACRSGSRGTAPGSSRPARRTAAMAQLDRRRTS
jgi:hypothetical protein